MTKKPREKFKYLENEKSFQVETKRFFIIFKELSWKQRKETFLEGESPTLMWLRLDIKISNPTVIVKNDSSVNISLWDYRMKIRLRVTSHVP